MKLGIIGGSAFYSIDKFEVIKREMASTPYGVASSPVVYGSINGNEFVFLHRHGFGHTLTPHQINYRANLFALKQLGVTHVVAIAAVGGITKNMTPGKIVFPHQIIDYTYSREHTYYDEKSKPVIHVDFTHPYDETLRQVMMSSSEKASLTCESEAVYAATQGPRLESIAEINRLERDGCDIVGMTGMPEAGLARELEMKYVCCASVVNAAAGRNGKEIITMDDIEVNLASSMQSIHQLLLHAIPEINKLS